MKAISLISGGLDSGLATKLIIDQGIEVVGFNCVTPFSTCSHPSTCNCVVRRISSHLNIELKVIKLEDEFINIVKHPKHGYGSNLNPCIDCKTLMLKKAKEMMKEIGASFIVTGEVLGQRPMSQKRLTILKIEREAGLDGLIVRPLCAKLLEQSNPEELGWVDRNKLLGLSGRGRKEQLALAEKFSIVDFSTPAGGCLLTNEGYSRKVKDLIGHEGLTTDNINPLQSGRHFRISPKLKLIVGRDEKENLALIDLAKPGDMLFEASEESRGPVAIGKGLVKDQEELDVCCKIIARYFDQDSEIKINISKVPRELQSSTTCLPFKDSELTKFRI